MRRILDCPECDWKTKPKHKRPKSALGLHRKAKHGNGTVEKPVSPVEAPVSAAGFLVTFASGEQHFVPAEEHQETLDRHWFFRGGALKETFKRNTVAAVEVA